MNSPCALFVKSLNYTTIFLTLYKEFEVTEYNHQAQQHHNLHVFCGPEKTNTSSLNSTARL